MRDAASRGRLLHARIPRRVAFDHDDEVGLADQRAGVVARMHRVATTGSATERGLWQTTGMAARSATFASAATALLVGAGPGRDDQRPLGLGDPFGKLLDRRRIGIARRRHRARRDRRRFGERRRQRLARQHQIDRPARRGHGHLMRARDHVGDLLGMRSS